MNTNIALWREVPDDAFERHFRQRYFGNESISCQQAIERLVAIRAKSFHTAPVPTQDTYGSNTTLNGAADASAKSRIAAVLIILQVSAALMLLLACANVSGLLLARTTLRQKETGIRTELGATHSRLIRQLLTERYAHTAVVHRSGLWDRYVEPPVLHGKSGS